MQATSKKGGAFTHTEQPSSLPRKRKYRDTQAAPDPAGTNLMWDKRVIRGNTYAAQVLPLSAQTEMQVAEREAQAQRKRMKEKSRKEEASRRRSSTPDAIHGRKHIEIQTEPYLEELTDKVEENTVDTQTDPMMDRPPTPLYVPLKTGRDTETQIEDGDLFDFDFEADPILEVLVGKTMEQAMLELEQEAEMEAIRQGQLAFDQKRMEEQMELERMEAAEKRKCAERERRKQQEIERLKREKQANAKLASRAYAQQLLVNLENRVFGRLEDEGWFYDSVERAVETDYLPWLMEQMAKQLEKKRKIANLAEDLLKAALAKSVSATSN